MHSPAPYFRPLAVAVLVSLFSWQAAGAALRWEKTEIELQASPADEAAEGIFRFTNTSGSPVTILSATASCGCTVPELTKSLYAPGENGELRAVFTFGDRVGQQEKMITVATDESGAAPQVLTLKVTIPKLIEVTPYFVTWQNGEEPKPKSISLRTTRPDLVTPVSVESRDTRVSASIEKVDGEEGAYRIVIKPQDTSAALSASVIVNLSAPQTRQRAVTVYALVRTPSVMPPGANTAPAQPTKPVTPSP